MTLRDRERKARVFNYYVIGFILCVVAIFIGPILYYTLQSAQNSSYLSTTAVNTVGTFNLLLGNPTQHKDGTIFGLAFKFGLLADKGIVLTEAGTGTLNAATGTLNATTGTITEAGKALKSANGVIGDAGKLVKHVDGEVTKADEMFPETKRKIDHILDEWATLPKHLNDTADASTETIKSVRLFMVDPETVRLRANLADLAGSGSTFLDSGALFTTHADNALFPVYHGHHPKWNETKNVSLGLLGLTSKGTQIAYYGVGAFHGQ
jgi:hypothetical protein